VPKPGILRGLMGTRHFSPMPETEGVAKGFAATEEGEECMNQEVSCNSASDDRHTFRTDRTDRRNSLAMEDGISQDYSSDVSLPDLVAAWAEATPDAPAVVAQGQMMTYRELDSAANRLAHHLRSLGAKPETLVALCLERSPALVVAALGVLKSGAAYFPLDPACPPERLAFLLNDSNTPIIVTRQRDSRQFPAGKWHVVDLDADAGLIASRPANPPESGLKPENAAYVIYTSGSTGQPKGVEITHDSLLNLVFWHRCEFAVRPADRATLQANPGFDASVWELWPYMTAGACLYIPDDAIRTDPESLRDWLVEQRITLTFLPTAIAELIMALEWPGDIALRALLTGAETLHHFPSLRVPFAIVNNYGPTECTVVATSGTVPGGKQSEQRPSIGRPILNTLIYILDEKLRPVPTGDVGEIYIGGKGLARGYRCQPELTAKSFVPDPFRPGSRLYKTGDLGRYLPGGEIAFVGRIDDQIKIRGYRVEPNEIIAVLDRHQAIQASHVAARDDIGKGRRLVAYIVPAPGSEPTEEELRDFACAYLPEYMVPAVFVLLESLPLTANGKVDRDRLPVPETSAKRHSQDAVPARTQVEIRVAAILARLLHLPDVGVNDNFFLLGGHSLLGTQVIMSVSEAFGVKLSLRTLFDAPTVAELSAEVERLLLRKLEAMSEDDAHSLLKEAEGNATRNCAASLNLRV
jgi:amino acid adenylation domain-containing protein